MRLQDHATYMVSSMGMHVLTTAYALPQAKRASSYYAAAAARARQAAKELQEALEAQQEAAAAAAQKVVPCLCLVAANETRDVFRQLIPMRNSPPSRRP